MPLTYLDNAATTLHKPPEVSAAMRKALESCGGSGRGGHAAAQMAAEVLFDCREAAASLFGMDGPERVILTANATHALNIAIRSLATPGKTVLISGYEHNAVIRPLRSLEQYGVKTVPLPSPLFDPETAFKRFEEALRGDVGLVVCIHVSNVFGFILPVEKIAELCRSKGVPMIIDASQSAGLLPINGDLGPYWCMPGHKSLYGPQGTGLLLIPPGGELSPLIEGGTGGDSRNRQMPGFLPDRLEAGTHNAPGAAGLAAGLRYVNHNGLKDPGPLTWKAVEELSAIKGVQVYHGPLGTHIGPVSFTVDGKDSETSATMLSDRNIAVRGGLHCAPLAHATAGTDALGTVRIAFSHANTSRDMVTLVRAVREIATGN